MLITKIVANQVSIMFILIILGYILVKSKIVTQGGSKEFSNILVNIVSPCVLIKSYSVDFNGALAFDLLKCFIFSIVIHIIAILVATIVIKKSPSARHRIDRYAIIYSNSGFMAIPLLQTVLGNEGVFFGSGYLVAFTIFSWTHGIYLYTNDKKSLSVSKIFTTPGIIGIVIGLFLFFTGLRLPKPIFTAVSYMADLNTPVAMIILGTFLADVNLKKAVATSRIYLISLFRLIVIPIIAIIIGRLINLDDNLLISTMLPAACPCATMAALLAAKYDTDAPYASEIVSINTLLSIITLPCIVALLDFIKF